jgi:hypothetical protein
MKGLKINIIDNLLVIGKLILYLIRLQVRELLQEVFLGQKMLDLLNKNI